MKFKVEGKRAEIGCAASDGFCAEEGAGVSTLEHLKALDSENHNPSLRAALEQLREAINLVIESLGGEKGAHS